MRQIIRQRMDVDGKVVETERDTTRFVGERYRGPWRGLMQISVEGMLELQDRMSDRTLGVQAIRVLWAMLNSVQVHDGNRVHAGRKDLARILAMDESDISKAIRKLIDCGFVEQPKFRFSPYVISPSFAWYSRTPDLKRALKDRGMLGKDGMMRAREAA